MRKDRMTKPLAAALVLGALFAASAAVNFTKPAAAQATQAAQKGRAKFRRVRVTPGDIARLPAGQNYVVQVSADVRGGAGGGSGLTKAGSGTLTLAGGNTVYEFRSDSRPFDYGRVVVQAGADASPVPLEAWLRKHRPAAGMRGWPFKRLLIGPPEGVAEVEGWKIKDGTPGTEYKCEDGGKTEDGFCSCSSYLDCVGLVLSLNCSSELTCGDGECFCDAR